MREQTFSHIYAGGNNSTGLRSAVVGLVRKNWFLRLTSSIGFEKMYIIVRDMFTHFHRSPIMSKKPQRLELESLECRTNPSSISYNVATNTIVYSGGPFETNNITVTGNGNTVTIQDAGANGILVAPPDLPKFIVNGNSVTYIGNAQVVKVQVNGNDMNDTISAATLLGIGFEAFGGEGNDTIHGSNGDDLLEGNGGNDIVMGLNGHDTIRGGNGDDYLYGESDLAGDSGSNGGANDHDDMDGGSGVDILFGNGGDDSLRGGDGNDNLFGGDGRDGLAGDAGDDLIMCGDNNDDARGGDGADTIHGGVGNDFLSGDDGNDFIHGGFGNDGLLGGTGNDLLFGETGDDTLEGNDDNDYLEGGVGFDNLKGNSGNDWLVADDSPTDGDGDIDRLTDNQGVNTFDYEGSLDIIVLSGQQDTLRPH
jgi:Ca2+-binding RTX toxin-like protein